MSNIGKLKDTLNLPKTDFPMQAKLVEREPERLKQWDEADLYRKIQAKNAGKPTFVLHDGPPFTNGSIHIGTALNKILKDIILRFKSMRGFSTPFIPGWDCHGLPIEHKVIKTHPECLKDLVQLRRVCAQFSEEHIAIQEEQFRRLGVLADWEHAYKTKDPNYESAELKVFAKCVREGLVYRSKKPVYWSIPCKTALAEAEIEYKQDYVSTTVWVKFALLEAEKLGLDKNTSLVIWTTTPWTLPANRGIALSPNLEYVEVKTDTDTLLVAEALAERFIKDCELQNTHLGKRIIGKELENQWAQHPFLPIKSRIVLADYITLDMGTGCVHTAPGHGLDDYVTGLKYQLEVACPVDDNGCFIDDHLMPAELIGKEIWKSDNSSPANEAVLKLLKEKGALLHQGHCTHAYPHCWRSKSPVIARALPQWFIRLDSLKEEALQAIENVHWIPAWGKKRIQGSVQARPDWCISRQRTWGLPLPVFYNDEGEFLLNADIIEAIAEKIKQYGSQWWFEADETSILEGISLPEGWDAKNLHKCKDTLDVWIDSGCSHAAVLDARGLKNPADLYLEGSDQHRGWFQSSLMLSLMNRHQAPYKTVLTHGFFVDEDRKKISKSSGSPQTSEAYVNRYGADILRLWVSSEDYRNDIPVSETIIQHVIGTYRTIRNTLRFQMGNLFDFNFEKNARPLTDLTALDRWALHETYLLVKEVTEAYENYEFHKVYQAANRFCSITLSARYHDILKDRLYTLGADYPERRSSQTALYLICNHLLRLLAPILCFTSDEAWGYLQKNVDIDSIHLSDFPRADETWFAPELAADFETLFKVREAVQNELEKARQTKLIGQSLDAKVTIHLPSNHPWVTLLKTYETQLMEFFIVSQVFLEVDSSITDLTIDVVHADGVRCPRTWRWVDHLVEVEGYGPVSERCVPILENLKKQA